MTIRLGSAVNASPSTTGTQDFTDTALGSTTPQAAISWAGIGTTNGNTGAGMLASMGFCADNGSTTDEFCISFTSESGVTTTNTARRYATDATILRQANDNTVRSEAEHSAWITNGVRLNWVTADPASNRRAGVFMLSDDNGSASFKVGSFTPNATQNSSTSVTAPGFRPHLVFLLWAHDSTADTAADDARCGFGVWANDGSVGAADTVGSWAFYSENGNAIAADVQTLLSTSYPAVEITTAPAIGAGLEITATASGFDVTTRDAAGTNWGEVGYLAIRFGSTHSSKVVTFDVPTGTGTDATTGVGFTPNWLIGLHSLNQALNTLTSSATQGSLGIGISDGTTELSFAFGDEDGVSTTNTTSMRDDDFFSVERQDTLTLQTGNVSSFDTDGFTLNWTSAVVGTAGFGLALALTEDLFMRPLSPTGGGTAGDPTIVEGLNVDSPTGVGSAFALRVSQVVNLDSPLGTGSASDLGMAQTLGSPMGAGVAFEGVFGYAMEAGSPIGRGFPQPMTVILGVNLDSPTGAGVAFDAAFNYAMRPLSPLGTGTGEDIVFVPGEEFMRPDSPLAINNRAFDIAFFEAGGSTPVALGSALGTGNAFNLSWQFIGGYLANSPTGAHQNSAPYWGRGQVTSPGFGRMNLSAPYWGRGQATHG